MLTRSNTASPAATKGIPLPITPKTLIVPKVAFAILAAVGWRMSVRGKKRMPIRLARLVVLLEPACTHAPTAVLLMGIPAEAVIADVAVRA